MDASLLIPIIGVSIPIVVVPTVLAFRHAKYLREVEHKERMLAMQLGKTLPGDESWTSPGRLIAAIGAGVPLAALVVAFAADKAHGVQGEAPWMACALIGISGVIGGTVLAYRHLFGPSESQSVAFKPAHDPDAFDVVGRRG